jgi:hypothetical protein
MHSQCHESVFISSSTDLQQIVSVPDANILQYWTMLYLCPNTFEPYDKDHSVEHHDSIHQAIKLQDAAGGLEIMIEFTIRMVIERWDKIGDYFAWYAHRTELGASSKIVNTTANLI